MAYISFELLIYIVWFYLVFYIWKKNTPLTIEERTVFITSSLMTIIMEMVNETVFKGVGSYYPASLFYFPGFQFPVAIVAAGGVFTWFIYIMSRNLANLFSEIDGFFFHWIHLLLFLILLLSCVLVEIVGEGVGYWQYHILPNESIKLWMGVYFFYFTLTFPCFIAGKFITRT